jgi:hypothetical protein
MGLPGFNAASALYRTSIYYKMSVGGENASGAVDLAQPLAAPVFVPGQSRPDAPVGPFPYVLCQPCALNQSGQCTQYCVHCPTPIPSPRCWVSFTPCAASECCPSGQSPCYVLGQRQSCCLPGYSCCDPETGFCCPPLETCCNPAKDFCCPPGQTPCCSTEKNFCCPPGQICCDPGNLCTDVSSDPQNCGACRQICPPGPANSTRTCIDGGCGWTCNSGYTQCGNACCPSGYGCCNGVCTPLNTTDNCGACGKVCPPGPTNSTRTCINGKCGWACNSGYTQCGNACCPSGGQCPGGAGCMCKAGGICNSGLTCVNGTCLACGQFSQLCCPGNTCSSGLTCQYSPTQNSYTCLP